jgi:hypothetical protein
MLVFAIVVLVIVFAIFAVIIYAIRNDRDADIEIRRKTSKSDDSFGMRIGG